MVADVTASGRWKNHKVNYFKFVLRCIKRTSSQTCGRWYLPTLLLRYGSLTLMYRASFTVLIWFKSSLPTMLKLLMVTLLPVMLLWSYMGEGDFRCSLNLSPKVLEDSLIYSSSQSTLSHWYLYMSSLCFWIGSLSLESHQDVLDSGASFKVHLYPKLSANVLNALTKSTVVWHHYVGLLLVVHLGSVGWNMFTLLLLCFHLYPFESPGGLLAILECILQVLFFLLQ